MKQSNFSVRQGRSRSYDALPLQRSDMPMDYLVSLENYTAGRTIRLPENLGPTQSFKVLIQHTETSLTTLFESLIEFGKPMTVRWSTR